MERALPGLSGVLAAVTAFRLRKKVRYVGRPSLLNYLCSTFLGVKSVQSISIATAGLKETERLWIVGDALDHFDGVGLGELIRRGDIRPSELLELAIQRIEDVNPQLNAVVHPLYEQAREIALDMDSRVKTAKRMTPKAPLYGVPFLLKDLIAE